MKKKPLGIKNVLPGDLVFAFATVHALKDSAVSEGNNDLLALFRGLSMGMG